MVQMSLLTAVQNGVATRYRMLDTLQSYGRAQLAARGEAEQLRERHASCYARLVQRTAPAVTAAEAVTETLSQRELDVLEASRHEFGAALDWSLADGRRDTALDILGHLGRYWWRRGFFLEGLSRCRAALADESDAEPSHRLALALVASSWMGLGACDLDWTQSMVGRVRRVAAELGDEDAVFAADYAEAHVDWRLGDLLKALGTLRRLIAAARNRGQESRLTVLLEYAGDLSVLVGQIDEAEACASELFEVGNAYSLTSSHYIRRGIAYFDGDLDRASRELDDLLELAREERDAVYLTYGLLARARIAIHRGELGEAQAAASQAIGIGRPAGMLTEVASGHRLNGHAAILAGDLRSADELLAKALRTHVATQDHIQMMLDVHDAGRRALAAGDGRRAARLLGAAGRERERMALVPGQPDQADYDRDLAALAELGATPAPDVDMSEAVELVVGR